MQLKKQRRKMANRNPDQLHIRHSRMDETAVSQEIISRQKNPQDPINKQNQ
jgi:hypothetical protein